VAAKRGQVKALAEGLVKDLTVQFERRKAQVRARVEHPFPILKNLFRASPDSLPGTGQEHRAVT